MLAGRPPDLAADPREGIYHTSPRRERENPPPNNTECSQVPPIDSKVTGEGNLTTKKLL